MSLRASAERPHRSATSPISLRLTAEERARLEAEVGNRTLSTYVRERLFDTTRRGRRHYRPSHDAQALARMLAALGQSGIAGSLRELAREAEIGAICSDCSGSKRIEWNAVLERLAQSKLLLSSNRICRELNT